MKPLITLVAEYQLHYGVAGAAVFAMDVDGDGGLLYRGWGASPSSEGRGVFGAMVTGHGAIIDDVHAGAERGDGMLLDR